jgi:RNA polymerase primary sigma factor
VQKKNSPSISKLNKRLLPAEENIHKRKIGETDPLALYLKPISQFPLLSLEEEQQIGERIQYLRDELQNLRKELEGKPSFPAEIQKKET